MKPSPPIVVLSETLSGVALANVLQEAGSDVTIASRPDTAALELAKHRTVAVLLSDIRLRGGLPLRKLMAAAAIDCGKTSDRKRRTVLRHVSSGEFGFLFDPHDTKQAQRAIEQCFRNGVSLTGRPPAPAAPLRPAIEAA